jgi:mRNA interferase RelE/StbE
MWQIRFKEDVSRDLEKLDKEIARRIVRKISWLAENIDNIQPKGLRADFSRLFKLREGDYRIIYEILKKEQIILIYFIGHRRDVYKTR